MCALLRALLLVTGVALAGSSALLSVGVADPLVAAQDDESPAALIQRLNTERERADPTLFTKLVKLRSAEAAKALVEVYDQMGSAGGKLRVLRALPSFADVNDAAAMVLDKLMNVATGDKRRLLRVEAIEGLSKCRAQGRSRLHDIVESPAEDEVRIEAMRLHVAAATAVDVEWYRKLWKPDAETDDKSKRDRKKKDDESAQEPRRLLDIQRLAFEGLVPHLTIDELVEALSKEGNVNLRLALQQLRERKAQEGAELADRIFGSLDADPLVRLEAAKLLYALRGADFLDDVEKVGSNRLIEGVLREGLAELYARYADEKALGKLVKNVSKGKAEEKIFYALACVGVEDAKLDKAYHKLLEDKELDVRLVAMRIAVKRKDQAALETLDEILGSSEDDIELAATLEALSLLRDSEIAWSEKVRGYVTSERPNLRVAAIAELARRQDAGAVEALGLALDHSDWATRWAAVNALRQLREPSGVPLLIARLPKEEGRLALAISDALFELTGQPFQKRAPAWDQWWREQGAGFKCIEMSELKILQRENEANRLEVTSAAPEFFGIQIESHRVAFVVDVSGSMEEKVLGRYVNSKGEMRITVAKAEITRFLDALEPGTWFNIIPFSDRAIPWRKTMSRKDGEVLAAAKSAVAALIASGGTNIYGGIQAAFADPEVDTIVVLSDGEPTAGEVIKITELRRCIAAWNEHRGIVIHTVQIGATFELLQWLAEDSGGETVLIP